MFVGFVINSGLSRHEPAQLDAGDGGFTGWFYRVYGYFDVGDDAHIAAVCSGGDTPQRQTMETQMAQCAFPDDLPQDVADPFGHRKSGIGSGNRGLGR